MDVSVILDWISLFSKRLDLDVEIEGERSLRTIVMPSRLKGKRISTLCGTLFFTYAYIQSRFTSDQ